MRPRAPAIAADWLLAARRAEPSLDAAGLAQLAEVLVEAARLADARGVVEEALAASAPDDGELAARLAVTGAAIERLRGQHDAARRRLERALERPQSSGAVAARLMTELAYGAYQQSRYPEMTRWAEQASATPGCAGVVRAAAAAMLATGRAFAGESEAAEHELAVALESVQRATDAELAAHPELAVVVPWALLVVERVADGLAAARRAAGVVRGTGQGAAALGVDVAVVLALGLLGRTTDAVEAADEADQSARVSGNPQALQWVSWMRAWALLERGDLDTALVAAEESVALAQQLDDSALAGVGRAVLGAVSIARGDHEQGRALLESASDAVDPGWLCRWTPWLVEADLALADHDAAAEHAATASSLARKLGLAGARAAAGRAEALLALARGDAQRATRLALAAAIDAEQIDGALDAARARLLAGRALATSDRAAAMSQLEAAKRQATACGARRVHAEAVRELRRLGRRVGHGGPRGPAGGTRPRVPERARARDRRARGRRTHQPRDRPAPIPQREDRRNAPLARLRQARRPLTRGGRSPGRHRPSPALIAPAHATRPEPALSDTRRTQTGPSRCSTDPAETFGNRGARGRLPRAC